MLQVQSSVSKAQRAFFGDYIDRQIEEVTNAVGRAYRRQHRTGEPVNQDRLARRVHRIIDAEMRRRTVEDNRVLSVMSKLGGSRDILDTINDYYAMGRQERIRILGYSYC